MKLLSFFLTGDYYAKRGSHIVENGSYYQSEFLNKYKDPYRLPGLFRNLNLFIYEKGKITTLRTKWNNVNKVFILIYVYGRYLLNFSLFLSSILLCAWSFSHIQLFVTPWTPAGSSVHGILHSVLQWVVIPFSSRSFRLRDWTGSLALQEDSLPSEPEGKPNPFSLRCEESNLFSCFLSLWFRYHFYGPFSTWQRKQYLWDWNFANFPLPNLHINVAPKPISLLSSCSSHSPAIEY